MMMMDMIEPSANQNSNILNINTNSNTSNTSSSSGLLVKKKLKDDTSGDWKCPVCDTKCDSQHSFTVHIRQHNPTDHSHTCSICGKTLSSASSLDRHMLIHSGERPFKCKICNMAFTTNGNMHRHMRTHGMESSENDSPDSNNNNRYKSRKRKNIASSDASENYDHQSDDHASSSPQNSPLDSKLYSSDNNADNTQDGSAASSDAADGEEGSLKVCDRSDNTDSSAVRPSSSNGAPHQPTTTTTTASGSKRKESIHCNKCGISLPNYASLSSHNCINSSLTKVAPKNGRNGPSIGFHDLTFTDFSSKKYPLIAKSFCEHNMRKSSSPYHDYECIKCSKAFPCGSALQLHEASHTSETYCHTCRCDLGTPLLYLAHQAKHQYQDLLSSVNGINLSNKAANGEESNGGGQSSSSSSSENSQRPVKKSSEKELLIKEKEQFLAMFQLQNRKVQEQLAMLKESAYEAKDEKSDFDYPSYFINAKPSSLLSSKGSDKQQRESLHSRSQSSGSPPINGCLPYSSSDPPKIKQDLADIPSIISNTANPLTKLSSSPPAATPASSVDVEMDLDDDHQPDEDHEDDDECHAADGSSTVNHSNTSEILGEEDDGGEASSNRNDKGDDSVKKDSSSSNQHATSSGDERRTNKHTTNTDVHMDDFSGVEKENGVWDSGRDEESKNASSYKCEICSMVFKTFNALKRHNRNHTKGGHNYVCNLCPYTSLDKSTLVRHLRTHNGERPFQCAICKYAFTTKANCERHVKKRHKKITKTEIKSAMQLNSDLTTSPSSNHLTIQNISKHNSFRSGYPSSNGGTNSHSLSVNDASHNSKSAYCRYCDIDLKNMKLYRQHMKSIHNISGQKPYSCALCKMGFSTKNNCVRHATRLHPELKDSFSSVVRANNRSSIKGGCSNQSYSGGSDLSECESATIDTRSMTSLNNFATRSDNGDNCGRPMSSSSSLRDHHLSASETATTLARTHSSLAALCQIAGSVSAQLCRSSNNHSTLFQNQGEGYDGDDSTDDIANDDINSNGYPLDLASSKSTNGNRSVARASNLSITASMKRGESMTEDSPLDLAVHALDLSVKSGKKETDSFQSQSLMELKKCSEPILTAASSLLALQAFVPHKNDLSLLSCISNSSTLASSNSLIKTVASSNVSPQDIPALAVGNGVSANAIPSPSPTAPASTASSSLSLSSPSSATLSSLSVSTSVSSCNNFININGIQNSLVSKNSRNFTCLYCCAQFTLKSNMERHIKRKHPEYARPVKKPSLPSSPPPLATTLTTVSAASISLTVADSLVQAASKQDTSATATISPVPSSKAVSLLSKTASNNASSAKLSNKTRAALRVVLNKKVANSNGSIPMDTSEASSPEASENGSPKHETSSLTNDASSRDNMDIVIKRNHEEDSENNEDTGGDLASLSTLIDNTANSSNTLKHYFDKAEDEDDDDDDENESRNGSNTISKTVVKIECDEDGKQSFRPEKDETMKDGNHDKNNNANNDSKSSNSHSVPKKRSAYTDSPNSVSCPYCSRRFPWTSSLRRHVLTHTGLKPFKCPKCPILFTTKSNCERHLVRKHGNDKRNLQGGKLRAEVVAGPIETTAPAVGSGIKQFKCNFCPSNYFSTQGSLRKHYYLRHWTKTARASSYFCTSQHN